MRTTLTSQLRKWHTYRRTYAELMALTDRELADLGFSRYDVKRIARESIR